ncbi:ribulose-phosphate 3-epimerase [Blastopirellula marina]|uniref:Ribulose-phosphate 3-epimerase n=1 Tax=Blastopirellula marina TaxID=124 RepID=A0A2S8F5F0_9BACT|nr:MULTISPECIES: ribulose-phosphate 3-epimerase [Pirellulaceae]PQO27377.1 ribulose-phosphate 3-epimerase [Blastopirellula marina]RCS47914.1 ribulose-phosphate 3-epimerase [Bremerella cremea]
MASFSLYAYIPERPVMPLKLNLGVKTDPIEYRYSFPWLFRLLAEEGIQLVQLGTWFELYQLPDEFFVNLRREAEDHGIRIASMFTAHRELGGFFRTEDGFEQVARRNFERLIEVGALLGATSVGSNPGAVLRDQMGTKANGVNCYVRHMKELMHLAHEKGVSWLTIEPMSCLAEPPTLPAEVADMGHELTEYHRQNANSTSAIGYCADIAHGYIDQQDQVGYDHIQLFEATYPWLYEVHLKNTDSRFNSTFGFGPAEREKGIVNVPHFRELLNKNADKLPVQEMTGYLEIGGPKLGRDYSDHQLADQLRNSLRYLKEAFLGETEAASVIRGRHEEAEQAPAKNRVEIAPSMMCVDALNFESALRQVEGLGVDMLHMDIMDGHFVPNMPMGLAVLERLQDATQLPLDVHLMVANNDFFVQQLANLRVSQISVHLESALHLDRTLSHIRDLGIKAGVAINPGTPLSAIDYVLERIDYVLVMTVNPGYAGQKMTPASLRKIADCHELLVARGFDLPIQVDGNVSFENIPGMVAAGATNLVAGTSSIFHKSGSMLENKRRMLDAIEVGLAARKNPELAAM